MWEGADVDLARLPVQTCWPGDAGPLITWGLTVTRGPHKKRQNLGIYRQQVIARNKVIMRWLAHRGGALDFRDHALAHPGTPFPVAVALGADPATILGAVTPVPDSLSEYQFAGLLRGGRTEIVKCLTHDLQVPATAEIVLEGFMQPDAADPTGYETAAEGPFGDHTGYYNEVERFPVLTIERITMRRDPIYHSTYTGKPPDEPAVLGVALNEVFVPLLQKQFPEIADFYLPPEGCSYRLAVVSMHKQYPGHAKRVMFGVWSFLRQFMYTKFIIVTDDDVDIRDWKEVVWALTTRVDPARDTLIVESTPIDYLDFASPVAGLGSKMGIDATNKWPGETQPRRGAVRSRWTRPSRRASTRCTASSGFDGDIQAVRRVNTAAAGPAADRAEASTIRRLDHEISRYRARHARKIRSSVAPIDSVRTTPRRRRAPNSGSAMPISVVGDRARRRAARGRRGRRDDARDGMPREQRLHPLQVRLRDEPRLALGRVLPRRHAERRQRSSCARAPRGPCRARRPSPRTESATSARSRRGATAARPGDAEEHDDAEDRGEAVGVPEVRDDAGGGEEQREQQAADPRDQQRQLSPDACAFLRVLDRASSARVRAETEQRVGEPRERAPQRRSSASRSGALLIGGRISR